MEVNEDIVHGNLAQRIFLGVNEQNCSMAGREGKLFFLKLQDTFSLVGRSTKKLVHLPSWGVFEKQDDLHHKHVSSWSQYYHIYYFSSNKNNRKARIPGGCNQQGVGICSY